MITRRIDTSIRYTLFPNHLLLSQIHDQVLLDSKVLKTTSELDGKYSSLESGNTKDDIFLLTKLYFLSFIFKFLRSRFLQSFRILTFSPKMFMAFQAYLQGNSSKCPQQSPPSDTFLA